MEVFLLILQIIGIVLGATAAFIAFAMITPLTYQMEGSFHRKRPKGRIKAGWLLNLVRVVAEYKKGRSRIRVKLLFFTVFDSTKNKRRKKRKIKTLTADGAGYNGDNQDDMFVIDEDERFDTSHEKKGKQRISDKIKSFFIKIGDSLKKAKEKAQPFLVWLDPEHRRLIAFLWKNGIKILKRVRPKSFSLKGSGGTGDPYSTGMILSWSGLLIGMLGIPGIEFEPDYENKRLDIDAEAKGYFFVLPVAWIAFKIYRNKDFKRFILKKNAPVEG